MVKKGKKKGKVSSVKKTAPKKKSQEQSLESQLPDIPQLDSIPTQSLLPQLEFIPAHLHRRIDADLRERQEHITTHAKHLQEREKQLEEWHKLLQHKEEQIVSKEKEYKEIDRLKRELEDKEISLHYLRSEVDWLKSQVSEHKPKHHSDENLERLKVHDHAPKEPVVVETAEPQVNPATHSIRKHITKAYSHLEKHQLKKAKDEYEKIRVAYSAFVAQNGPDSALYQDIVDLFTDIKLRL